MTTLPFRPPCWLCKGCGFLEDETICDECDGRGCNDDPDAITEDHGRIEIRDRHEEQIAGVRVIAWGFAALVFWLAGGIVGGLIWWSLS